MDRDQLKTRLTAPEEDAIGELYGFLHQRAVDLDAAVGEDVCHDLLHRLIQRFVQQEGGIRSGQIRHLQAYCTRTLLNRLRAARRPPKGPRRVQRDPALLEGIATDDPRERALRAELVGKVRACMCELPPRDEEVLRLSHVDGLSVPEIARSLQRSGMRATVSAVASRLRRARRRLRRLLVQRDLAPASWKPGVRRAVTTQR